MGPSPEMIDFVMDGRTGEAVERERGGEKIQLGPKRKRVRFLFLSFFFSSLRPLIHLFIHVFIHPLIRLFIYS